MVQDDKTIGDVVKLADIMELAKEVAKTTVEKMNELEAQRREMYSPQKAAKKMLSEYRRLKKVADSEIQPTKEEALSLQWQYLRELMGNPEEKMYAENVAYIQERKLQYNRYKVKKVERAFELYKQECEEIGTDEAMRRYRIIKSLYFENERVSVNEIADREHVTDKSIYKDIISAYKVMAVYLSAM